MLRGERGDSIDIKDIVQTIGQPTKIPESLSVVQRTDTYYGPVLLLTAGNHEFRITAPGPDYHLLLWASELDETGSQERWRKVAEVRAELSDCSPYERCSVCDRPIRTAEHKRLSTINECENLPEKYQ